MLKTGPPFPGQMLRSTTAKAFTFSANSSDLDGDTLTYKWFLDELEEVGTGVTLSLKDVDPGDHKVTVEVTDPSGESSKQDFVFKVNKKSGGSDGPGFGSTLVIAAMAIMVVALVSRRRR